MMAVTRQQYRKSTARKGKRHHHPKTKLNGRHRSKRLLLPRKCASSSTLPLCSTSPVRSTSRKLDKRAVDRSKSEGTKTNTKGKSDNGLKHEENRKHPGTSRSSKLGLHKTKKCTCIKAKTRVEKSRNGRTRSSVGSSSPSEASGGAMLCSSGSSVRLVDSGQTRGGKKRRRLLYNDNTKQVSCSESAVTVITINSDDPDSVPMPEPEQPGRSGDLPYDAEDIHMLQNVLDALETPQQLGSDPIWPADLQDINLFPLQPPVVNPPVLQATATCANCSNRLVHDIITLAKFYGVGLCSNANPVPRNPDSEKRN